MGGLTAVERLPENQLRWLEAEWRDTNCVSLHAVWAAMSRLSAVMMWEASGESGSELKDELTCLTNVARIKFVAREG
jgi:hypothetical protein